MKRLLTTIVFACAGILASNAQTERGNVMWGTTVSNFNLDFQEGNTSFEMDITPKIGYFIQDGLALGPELLIGLNTTSGSTTFTYGVGGFGRYFLGPAPEIEVIRGTRWFVEANAGINGTNVSTDGQESTNTNGLGIGFGPGLSYFLTDRIALEGLLKYNLTVGFGSSTTSNRLGLGIGFQIYLPGRELAKKANE